MAAMHNYSSDQKDRRRAKRIWRDVQNLVAGSCGDRADKYIRLPYLARLAHPDGAR